MDQGPVDAGPTLGDEYNANLLRDYSPEFDRPKLKAKAGLNSPSARKANSFDEGGDDSSGPDHGRNVKQSETSNAPPSHVDSKEDAKGRYGFQAGFSSPHRMHRFTLYETNARYWITGSDVTDKYFRLLRIDRTSPPGQITAFEDETVYDRNQMNDVLTAIDQGNKATNGLRKKYSFWGLVGFIRFTEAYYMLLITKRVQAAMIGGHYVYQIDGTDLVPLTTGSSGSFLRDRHPDEARFLGILNNLDLTKSFYFSYSYDITNSLQANMIRRREATNQGQSKAPQEHNDMFVWNHHLLGPAVSVLKHPYDWCLPIIHGFLNQAAVDIFGRKVYITIIGRRSRFFAGARFLKRGTNDLGYVANDVETEQIVADKLTTSFHAPGPRLYSSPTYTSYLQHRGSIPLYWIQENSGVTPKPGIDINLSDPFYQPAALHFDNMFERYGCPIYVVNLVKSREKTPRESKLLHEYEGCVNYLNQSLPDDKKIIYKAFDMARAAKAQNSNVISGLESIAKDILERTGFFHNGEGEFGDSKVQNGIARTNCIDCLDRTNAAQFVIGKHALALQLRVLGIIGNDDLSYDTDAIDLYMSMFHAHGDSIAMQYGGSHLVNTMATYRKLSHWSSSRDMMESFKRYYHNSFLDSQRQEAYNLFLGNYIWTQGQPMLWDLATDYYLHHSDPRSWIDRRRRNYIHWYSPEFLQARTMPPKLADNQNNPNASDVSEVDDYWKESYRPTALSSLQKVYSYRMTSTQRYLHERPSNDNMYNFSPFVRRADSTKHETHASDKKLQRKGVKILDPHEVSSDPWSVSTESLPLAYIHDEKSTIMHDTIYEHPNQQHTHVAPSTAIDKKPTDKTQAHLWTLNRFYTQSLDPSVSEAETKEYSRYVAHPLNLPLVVSPELPSDANLDYVEYIHRAGLSAFDNLDLLDENLSTGVSEADLQDFSYFARDREDPLTVTTDDDGKKRYKVYKQWLKGKSLFKQSKVDPEFNPET